MFTSSPCSALLSTFFSWSLVYFSSSTSMRSSLQTLFHTITHCTRDSTQRHPFLAATTDGMRAAKSSKPPFCVFLRLLGFLRTVRLLFMTYYHSHVSAPAFIKVIVAKSLFVFLNALVRYWGCEISDCVIQGLHLDQKSLKLLHRKSSHIGSQFNQCFVISGVGKATHVDLKQKLLKLF